MVKAVVKYFNDRKGYGFVTIAGLDKDVFIHYSALQHKDRSKQTFNTLVENQTIDVEYIDGKYGPQVTAAYNWESSDNDSELDSPDNY